MTSNLTGSISKEIGKPFHPIGKIAIEPLSLMDNN